MDLSILSANLRRIRAMKGLTQVEVADAADLSRVGYRNIEAGEAAPRVDSLVRIAKALEVNLDQLVESVPGSALNSVRFRALKKMTSRQELLEDVARWLRDYNELEEQLHARAPFGFGPIRKRISGIGRGEARARKTAEQARKEVELNDDPIRDICGLLEDNGVKVYTPQMASEGFFGLSVGDDGGGPAVVVNRWDRLSDELGHLLLHADAYDVKQEEEDISEEKEADIFASYFLMPESVFNKELKEASGLPLLRLVFKLKRIFRVSWKTVVYRVASQATDGQKLWGRFQAEYRDLTGRTLGKADEPAGLAAEAFRSPAPSPKAADEPENLVEGDFVQDRLFRLVRRAVEEDKLSLERAAEVLRVDFSTMQAVTRSWINSKH